MLYKLWKDDRGRRFYMVGTVRRITHQARIEWQQAREAEAVDASQNLEIGEVR